MGWAYSPTDDRLVLNGGAQCPNCKKGSLCLNGGAAVPGHRIATCHDCHAVRCARCGKTAVVAEVTPQGKKYACDSCR